MTRSPIIGIMGGGSASSATMAAARNLGAAIAREGWILLNGGRNAGIMKASSEGAASEGGVVIGILPDAHLERMAKGVTIPIRTGLGDGRNLVNVLSSDIVVAFPGGAGTISEVALALKNHRPLLLFDWNPGNWVPEAEERRVTTVSGCMVEIRKRLFASSTQQGQETS